MELKGIQKQVVEFLQRSNRILIMPSSPPDGDSLGSALAMYSVLRKLNKEVTVVFADPVPEVYKFMPNIQVIAEEMFASRDLIITLDCRKTTIATMKSNIENDKVNIIITPQNGGFQDKDVSLRYGDVKYDLIITVDCAELSQLGKLYKDNIEMFTQLPVMNIDHHISNAQYGKINYIDVMSSSSTQLLIPIVKGLEKETGQTLMDPDIATLLLAGIITDTGSFQNSNTTPKSFAVAAELVSYGARQQEIIRNIYKTKKLSMLKLWGRVLSKIKTDDKHRIVWSTVTQQDLQDTHSKIEQTGDIIDELMSNAPGAEIIILLKEKENGKVSGSIRTTTPAADASYLAQQFDGGGHTQAAGFSIEAADFEQLQSQVIEAVRKYQAERLNLIDENSKNHLSGSANNPEDAQIIKVDLEDNTSKTITMEIGQEHKINEDQN